MGLVGKVMSMDKLVGKDFEKGLARLKAVAEQTRVSDPVDGPGGGAGLARLRDLGGLGGSRRSGRAPGHRRHETVVVKSLRRWQPRVLGPRARRRSASPVAGAWHRACSRPAGGPAPGGDGGPRHRARRRRPAARHRPGRRPTRRLVAWATALGPAPRPHPRRPRGHAPALRRGRGRCAGRSRVDGFHAASRADPRGDRATGRHRGRLGIAGPPDVAVLAASLETTSTTRSARPRRVPTTTCCSTTAAGSSTSSGRRYATRPGTRRTSPVPWPTCWCSWRIPDDSAARALDAYREVAREGVPHVATDEVRRRHRGRPGLLGPVVAVVVAGQCPAGRRARRPQPGPFDRDRGCSIGSAWSRSPARARRRSPARCSSRPASGGAISRSRSPRRTAEALK